MPVLTAARSFVARSYGAQSSGHDFTGLVGWVVDVIAALGPAGVFLALLADNLLPVIPSEVVLPFAGYLSARGAMSFWAAFAAATAGSTVSAYVLYELGRRLGPERSRAVLCRVPLMDAEDADRAKDWFSRHGDAAVFTGRFVPLVRSLVSLPAGTEGMSRWRFGVLTTAGSGLWNLLWLWLGRIVGQSWEDVGRYSDWFNWAIVVVAAVMVGRYVWQRRDRLGRRQERAADR